MQTTTVLDEGAAAVLDVLGPTVEILTPLSAADAGYCVMKGVIPPGVSVPLHSHPDEESFYLMSGAVEVLIQKAATFEWRRVQPGDVVHVPRDVKHAWRNMASQPAVALIVATSRLGRFFSEIGNPVTPKSPSAPPRPEILERFQRAAARYGHWLGTPEENATVGITLPG
jgi:quercetin dioxygenase-like cupin family protein